MNVKYPNPAVFAALGLFTAFAFAVILAIAINADPNWVYGENTLSDLGVSSVQLSADLFNYGCIIVGALICIFGLGKAGCEFRENRASGCMIAISGIFLLMIGFISKDFGNGNLHELIAYLVFLFLLVAVVLSAIGDMKEGNRLGGAITATLLLIALGSCVGMDLASVEVVAVACAILWIMNLSAKMLLSKKV